MAETEGFSSRQKVAILMIALGQDTSAEILKYLNDYEIEDIAQTIAELRTVTTDQEDEVLEEFETLLMAGKYISMGGIDFARGTLEKAMGPRRAQTMLDRVTATTTGGFYLLRNIAPNQIAPFISKEHPQTIALILSQLDPSQAAGVLNILPEELQSEVTYRVAAMENISPQVLREIEDTLANELQAILTGQITEIGGPEEGGGDPEHDGPFDGEGRSGATGLPGSRDRGGDPEHDVHVRRHREPDGPGDPDGAAGGGHEGSGDCAEGVCARDAGSDLFECVRACEPDDPRGDGVFGSGPDERR